MFRGLTVPNTINYSRILSGLLSLVLVIQLMSPVKSYADVVDRNLIDPDSTSGTGSGTGSGSTGSGSGSTSSSGGFTGPAAGATCGQICAANKRWETHMLGDQACMRNADCKACVNTAMASSIYKAPCQAMEQTVDGKTWQTIIAVIYAAVAVVCIIACIPLPWTKALEGVCQWGSLGATGLDLVGMIFMSENFAQDFGNWAMGAIPQITTTMMSASKAGTTSSNKGQSCTLAATTGVIAVTKFASLSTMDDAKQQNCSTIESTYGQGGFGSSVNDCKALIGLGSSGIGSSSFGGNSSGGCVNPYDPACYTGGSSGGTNPNDLLYNNNPDWVDKDWNTFIEESFSNRALMADGGMSGLSPEFINTLKQTALKAPEAGIDVNKIRQMAAQGASAEQIMAAGITNNKNVDKNAGTNFLGGIKSVQDRVNEGNVFGKGGASGAQGSTGQMTTGGGAASVAGGAGAAGEGDLDMAAMLEKLMGGGAKKEQQQMGVNAIGFKGGRDLASNDIFHAGSKDSIFVIVSRRIEKNKKAVESLDPVLPMNKALAR